MKELLERFENKQPEIVFEWSDSETDAKGWVVINTDSVVVAEQPKLKPHISNIKKKITL